MMITYDEMTRGDTLPETDELFTDPYGELEFSIGDVDDFVCFDFDVDFERRLVQLHSAVNSETGAFIQDFHAPYVVSFEEAVDYAQGMVDDAVMWCVDNDINLDSPLDDINNFVNAVRDAIS